MPTTSERSHHGSVSTWLYVAALIGIGAAARLPQLLSRSLLLEGDECILGLMARHLAAGREFPLFFYGQRYGLAVVEAPAAALSFLLFGAGAVPLKIAMLAIWLVGIVFYFLAFLRPLGATRSFWITMVLVLMPAWAATSMKAWSGYITAFAATGVAIYLITRNGNREPSPWLFAGAAAGVIYFAQPLWLPGLVPIVLFYLASSRRLAFWISFATGAVGVAAAIVAAKWLWLAHVPETWTRPPAGNPHLLASVPQLFHQMYVTLTGSYYFGTADYAGPVTILAAYLWLAVFALALPVQIYRVLTRKYLLWSHLLFASVCMTLLANWILLESRDGRYVLAVNAPLAFMAGIEGFDIVDRYRVPMRRCVLAILCVLCIQAVAMTEFARHSDMWWTNRPNGPSEAATLRKVVDVMRSRGVTRAFAMNALLQWPITFYSGETVIARWKADPDRYPPYIRAVDRALERGDRVAIVGYAGYTYGLEKMVSDPQTIITVDGKYFVYIGPDKDLLRKLGFRLPP
jgi:hypothetical protein